MNDTKTIRSDLLDIFSAATDAVGGTSSVKKELEKGHYPNIFHVVAIGKAADAMLQGVIQTETHTNKKISSALVISKHNHISDSTRNDPRVLSIESDHPLPKQASLDAGKLLLDYIQKLPKNEACVFLISGGASALVEVLHNDWNLTQLQELTDYLLANGYNINQINAVRRRLSKIKGGGLWDFIGNRPVYCLMISDVPGDNPTDIGSGLLFPVDDIALPEIPDKFKEKIPSFQQHFQADNFNWKIIASLDIAKESAAKKAIELGYTVQIQKEFLDDEATKVAKHCVNKSLNNKNTLLIWGGETLVHLAENPGRGGRNQHLALAAAINIENQQSTNTVLISAGTDGSDGISDATGAIIDGETLRRGKAKNLSASHYLKSSDSNTYLTETDDTIITGATGTNVMDLIMAITI